MVAEIKKQILLNRGIRLKSRCPNCGRYMKYWGNTVKPAYNPPNELVEFYIWDCSVHGWGFHKGLNPITLEELSNYLIINAQVIKYDH